jgi:acyl-CoA synthetase (AMP-forming)/AMP-acid ligase II/thioesterase domain-containing protein/acyl carrier protein/NADP-dependent 3-hydroxy acid dehydrogenase YdfG
MSQPKNLEARVTLDKLLLEQEQQLLFQQIGQPLEDNKAEQIHQQLPLVVSVIESALLAESSVTDCVVLPRESEKSQQDLIAYIVPAGKFAPEQIQSQLQTLLPETLLPKAYIPLANLPLTPTGTVDKEALAQLALLDNDLILRWEKILQLQPAIKQAAVIVEDYNQKIPHRHLSDLLPDWKAVKDGAIKISKAVEQPKLEPKPESKALAIARGKPLQLPEDAPKTLSEALLRATKQAPHQGITYIQQDGSEQIQTYPALLKQAEQIAAGLQQLGWQPQEKIILQLNYNQDFIPALWACLIGGFVPVPLATAPTYEPDNSAAQKLHNAWQILDRPLILTSDELAVPISNLAAQLELDNLELATLNQLSSSPSKPYRHLAKPEDIALLLLTSGSTGIPKAVKLSHRNILSSIAATSQIGGFTSQDISLNWLPLDHPGPLIRCVIRMVYLGCQQIHAPTATVLQNPLRWLDWLDRYRVTSTWAPNFAFALLNDRAEEINKRHWDLTSIKSFLNTAEPIVPQTAQRLLQLLKPHGLAETAMHSSWGMAETSSGVTHSAQYLSDSSIEREDSFAELGLPIPGIALRIVDEQDRVMPEQTIGYLQVKGATVTSGYEQNPEANREAFTNDGWFKTGDLGFLDRGRLTITGRSKDVIIINGNNCYSHEIESVVEEIAGVEVSYTAACGIRQSGSNTDRLLIFFHTTISEDEALLELLKKIQKNIVRQIGISPSYLIPVEPEAIPKTSIGKIQRSQLKQRFEAGEFAAIVKKIDILLGNDNTLPDWFYRPIWRSKEAVTLDDTAKTGLTLIFLDSLGLGEYLSSRLHKRNQICITVEIGTYFSQLSQDRYRIDPSNCEHYRQLLESVLKENSPIEQILHLWTYEESSGKIASLEQLQQAQNKGVCSLLFLVQALDKVQGSQTPVRLQVISSHSQAVADADKVACERSPILGLVKTIPQEMTWLDCRHLDLPLEDIKLNANCVLRELQVIQQEREVAYRKGERAIARLEKVNLTQGSQQLPFQQGGIYLISGGLGGIAVEIARYLLENYQARLLLIGRTPLPARNTWSAELEREGKVSERIQAYLALEQLEGEVAYEAADICDLTQLQQVVERHCRHWQGELDGVIHLAGTIQTRSILEEKIDSFAATLRPKVEGTWVLHQLLQQQPNGVFITFSSVNGFFGRMTAGAYSAANRFLDTFSQYQRSRGSLHYCLAWSMWEETGLSRNYQMKELNRARGYSLISPRQGLNSFLVGLHQNHGCLLVGLDRSKQFIRQYVEMEARPTQSLSAYFTAESESFPLDQLESLTVCDRFGIPSTCQFKQLAQMPLTETGEIDREQLVARGKPVAVERVAPKTELEKQLASIWQRVLNVPSIGIHDNFFELGGDSIKAVRLFGEIEQTFGQNLPLVTLFQTATIEGLASIIGREEESASWSSLVPIQPNGSKLPLFCLHGAGGNVLVFRDLARHLGEEQPFYGLQSRGLNGQEFPLTTVEDMARCYLEEIKTVQPTGSYLLAGYCLGSKVALEMAQLLRAEGEEVALLALLEPDPIRFSTQMSRLASERSYRDRFKDLHYRLVTMGIVYLLKQQFLKVMSKLYQSLGLSLPQSVQIIKVEEINVQASRKYVAPQTYPGKVSIFLTSEQTAKFAASQQSWTEIISGELEIHEVPGRHEDTLPDSFLKEPYVKVLAEKLKEKVRLVPSRSF